MYCALRVVSTFLFGVNVGLQRKFVLGKLGECRLMLDYFKGRRAFLIRGESG